MYRFKPQRTVMIIAMLLIIILIVLAGIKINQRPAISEAAHTDPPLLYNIHARWLDNSHTLQTTADITFRNEYGDPLSELVFHWFADVYRNISKQPIRDRQLNKSLLETKQEGAQKVVDDFQGGITTYSVTTASGKPLTYNHQNQALTINLPKRMQPGTTIKLTIRYEVKFPFGAHALSYSDHTVGGYMWTPQLAVYNQSDRGWNRVPYNSSYRSDFYPMGQYHVMLDVPEAWEMVTNGQEIDREQKDGRLLLETKSEASRQIAFYGGRYKQEGERTLKNNLRLSVHRIHTVNDQKSIDYAAVLDTVASAADWLSATVGPLPYPELKLVEAPYSGMSYSPDGIVVFSRQPDGSVRQNELIRAVAKQWTQNAIGSNASTDGFISDGLSAFLTAYFEHDQKNKPWPQPVILNTDMYPPAAPAVRLGADAELHYQTKGTAALIQWVNQYKLEAFNSWIQSFYRTYSGKMTSVNGLLNTVSEQISPQAKADLEALLTHAKPSS
ncbi:hypothetical protein MH117_21295 [Paenibacillus sp. ACRRX]|uniref:hypothetical protein n=1 Tax=Paenibacillus sp. ACRRX TaxID=2918206 RepID=UPI001EF65039|nr:hypothetical protein [Paenibacillus sp. ACRRX]MCG7409949.1 hypothetical protein [Paenibacillus sp. ACRRX]